MIKYLHIFIFSLFLLFISPTVWAQEKTAVKRIHINRANKLDYNKRLGNDAQRLIGDVEVEHDGSVLWCDSAYLYGGDKNSMDAFGHVHIVMNDTVNLFGDRLFYNGNKRIAEVHQNVKLQDKKLSLYTDSLIYFRNEQRGEYFVWGKVVDTANVLTSKKGIYYTQDKMVFFKDSVVVVNKDYILSTDTLKYNTQAKTLRFRGPTDIIGDSSYMYAEKGFYNTLTDFMRLSQNAFMQDKANTLEGDSLYYDKATGLAEVFDHVRLTDTVQHISVLGNYANYKKKQQKAFVVDRAMAILVDEGDSLFIHADTLKVLLDTANKIERLLAYQHMKLFRDDFQGMSDSLVYQMKDSTVYFYKEPVLWYKENQFKADEIQLVTHLGEMDSVLFNKNVFLASQDTIDPHFYNQIKGNTMVGWFHENDLRKLRVEGNSETVYFLWEEDQTPVGMTRISASDMLIYMKENQLETISYQKKPKAKLYPPDQIPPDQLKLNGFIWLIDKRPLKKEDIFNWEGNSGERTESQKSESQESEDQNSER
jgi:lipopolysaccharide export system protein LptA